MFELINFVYLQTKFYCVLNNERLVVFELQLRA